jgi:hypothetical protein
MINHTSRLSAFLSLDNSSSVKRLFLHRLFDIKLDLAIPFSPLLLDDFSVFEKLPIFRTDFVFRVLTFAKPLGISFARALPASDTSVSILHHTPIHTVFQGQPALYRDSLHLLKKHRISYLSDCLDKNSLSVLPYRDVIKKNSLFPPSKIVPRWYKHLVKATTVSANLTRLADIYKARSQQLDPAAPLFHYTSSSDHGFSHIQVPRRFCRTSFWCATWNSFTDSPVFGQVLQNNRFRVVVQHWIHHVIDKNFAPTELTPSSQPLRLVECSGCSLHDLSCLQLGNLRPNLRLARQPCLFASPHDSFVDIKFLQQSTPQAPVQSFRTNLFHLSFSLRAIFSPHIAPL